MTLPADPLLAVSVRAARRAEAVIVDAPRDLKRLPAFSKEHGDTVSSDGTEAGHAIVSTIAAAFADHAILAEASGAMRCAKRSAPPIRARLSRRAAHAARSAPFPSQEPMVTLVRYAVLAVVLAAVLGSAGTASAQDFVMRCESRDFAYNFCPSGGRVTSAQIVRQLSRAPCQLGRTWGWQGHGIWVSDGCAGEFRVPSNVPPPPPPSAYLVACESREYRYNFCDAGRVRSAQLVRQQSQAPCLQGRTWGWTPDGIWVDQGCAGTFHIR